MSRPASCTALRTASSARSRSPRCRYLPNLVIPAPTTLSFCIVLPLSLAQLLLISGDAIPGRFAIPCPVGKRLLLQYAILNTVRTGLRERVSQFDVPGYGVLGHLPLAEIENLLGSGNLTRLEDHDQLDLILGEFRWDRVCSGL